MSLGPCLYYSEFNEEFCKDKGADVFTRALTLHYRGFPIKKSSMTFLDRDHSF